MMRLIAALSLVAALAVVIPLASASARTPIDDAAVTITVVVIDDLVPKAVPFTDFEVVRADGQGESRRIRTDDKGVVTTSLPAGLTISDPSGRSRSRARNSRGIGRSQLRQASRSR